MIAQDSANHVSIHDAHPLVPWDTTTLHGEKDSLSHPDNS